VPRFSEHLGALRHTETLPVLWHWPAAVPLAANPSTTSTGNAYSKVIDAPMDQVESPILVLWDELPSWQQNNELIKGSYRRASHSSKIFKEP
jgi:hypothetical protein